MTPGGRAKRSRSGASASSRSRASASASVNCTMSFPNGARMPGQRSVRAVIHTFAQSDRLAYGPRLTFFDKALKARGRDMAQVAIRGARKSYGNVEVLH